MENLSLIIILIVVGILVVPVIIFGICKLIAYIGFKTKCYPLRTEKDLDNIYDMNALKSKDRTRGGRLK